VEQSSGRSQVFVVFSREVWDLRDSTPPNKEKPFQTRKNLSKQGKTFPNKKTPPNKKKHLQTRKNLSKQEKTFPNKEKHHQTRRPPFKQEKYLPKQGRHLSSKENAFQARGIFQSNVVYKW